MPKNPSINQTLVPQNQQQVLRLTIEYEGSVRSIDLENLLTGFRMLCQYELAERYGGQPRDYTSVTKIQSIEKGSIDIFVFINVAMDMINVANDVSELANSDNFDLWDAAEMLYNLICSYKDIKQIADNKKFYVKSIISAVSNFKSLVLRSPSIKKKLEVNKSGGIRLMDYVEENIEE